MSARDADPGSPRLAVSATGTLAAFNRAGVLDAADVHVAQTLGWLAGETAEPALLAAALAVRAQRSGSVCLPLARGRDFAASLERGVEAPDLDGLAWPDPTAWPTALEVSPLVCGAAGTTPPLCLHEGQLYLARAWADQERVRRGLLERWRAAPPRPDEARLADAIRSRLGIDDVLASPGGRALWTAGRSWTTVIAGGPGTGKTTLVGDLVRVLTDIAPVPLRVALAAPTGKAASRLADVAAGAGPDVRSGTLHRLLGSRGPGRGFRHGPANPVPFDIVIVDEMSMVSLTLMSSLLDALAPTTRLVLVGDPDQLSSVDAGAVLADLVAADLTRTRGSPEPATVVLEHTWRYTGAIAVLADAVRRGDAAATIEVLTSHDTQVQYVPADPGLAGLDTLPDLREAVRDQASAVRAALAADDPGAALRALDTHRLLCAHREGPYGAAPWGRAVEALARTVAGAHETTPWYRGRAVLMTQNQPDWGASNGDQGLVWRALPEPTVVFGEAERPATAPLALLEGLQPLYAMTVHKAQGSQYAWITLVLPPPDSPLLVRELVYTALTRARQGVRVLGTPEAVAQAVRTPAWRASGLARRLVEPD